MLAFLTGSATGCVDFGSGPHYDLVRTRSCPANQSPRAEPEGQRLARWGRRQSTASLLGGILSAANAARQSTPCREPVGADVPNHSRPRTRLIEPGAASAGWHNFWQAGEDKEGGHPPARIELAAGRGVVSELAVVVLAGKGRDVLLLHLEGLVVVDSDLVS